MKLAVAACENNGMYFVISYKIFRKDVYGKKSLVPDYKTLALAGVITSQNKKSYSCTLNYFLSAIFGTHSRPNDSQIYAVKLMLIFLNIFPSIFQP